MAKYKVWLTVLDSFGNKKEIDGGSIDIGLDQISDEELAGIENRLNLDDTYATDAELHQTIIENKGSLLYQDLYDDKETSDGSTTE